jgi:hypothetical protein
MKRLLGFVTLLFPFCLCLSQNNIVNNDKDKEELNRITFCIGVGYSQLFNTPSDYYLTTDALHKLQVQPLNKSNVVISSIITIKLSKLATQLQQGPSGVIKKKLVSAENVEFIRDSDKDTWRKYSPDIDPRPKVNNETGVYTNSKPTFWQSLAVSIGINLADAKTENIAFNKSIDGGIGLGYYANDFLQIAIFLDKVRYRQLRDYFVENFRDQSIPNGNDFYNALDVSDNNLFYSKYYTGLSLKFVFSFGNKK